jgi:Lon protease-like protein
MKTDIFEENWEDIFRAAIDKTEIPIMPRKKVIYPYEWWHEEIKNPIMQKVLLEAYNKGKYIGMTYSEKGDNSLPPVGSIGTIAAFSLQKVNKKKYLVKFMGLPRFSTVEYLIKGTIYPVARIEYFEDEAEDPKEIRKVVERVVALMEETDRIRGTPSQRHRWLEMVDNPGGLEALTYGTLKYWSGNTETRHYLLGLRSAIKRLEYLQGLIYHYNRNEAIAEGLRKNN